MKFQAILYEKRALAAETELMEWMETTAASCGIQCIEVGDGIPEAHRQEPVSNAESEARRQKSAADSILAELLRTAAARHGVKLADCLFIVTNETEWEVAAQLDLAALPYVPAPENKNRETGEKSDAAEEHLGTPRFPGAWIVAEGFGDADFDFFRKCYQRAHNLPWEILSTERCTLRELTLDDMDALFALYEQPGVTDYMEGLYERSEEERYERAYIENMYRYYGYGMWLVCKKESGEIIGRAGLEHREYHGEAELEMGYMIAPAHQRKGYASEVCRALVEYARENLDFPRLNCLIRADNLVSKHLAKRLGFAFFEKVQENGVEMDRYIYCFLQKNRI